MNAHCGGEERCHHFEVDDEEELDRKRMQLSFMVGVGNRVPA